MNRFLLWIAGFLVWTGCSTGNAAFDYDKDAPFETYYTFNFLRPDVEELKKHGVERPDRIDIVESAIEEQLVRRGYRRQKDAPDLIVTFFAKVENRQRANTTSVAVGGATGSYNSRFGYSVGTSNTRYVDYKQGTLIVDLVDARQNKLVWEGIASEEFDRKDNVQDKIYKTVDRIFYSYKFTAGQGFKKK